MISYICEVLLFLLKGISSSDTHKEVCIVGVYKHVIAARWKGSAGFDQNNKRYDRLPPEYDTPVSPRPEHTKEQNKPGCFQHKGSVTLFSVQFEDKNKIKKNCKPLKENNGFIF